MTDLDDLPIREECREALRKWWSSISSDKIKANISQDAGRHPDCWAEFADATCSRGTSASGEVWIGQCGREHKLFLRGPRVEAYPERISVVVEETSFIVWVLGAGRLTPEEVERTRPLLRSRRLEPDTRWSALSSQHPFVWVAATNELDLALGKLPRERGLDVRVQLTGRPSNPKYTHYVELIFHAHGRDLKRPTFINAASHADWRPWDGQLLGWGCTRDCGSPHDVRGVSEAVTKPLRPEECESWLIISRA